MRARRHDRSEEAPADGGSGARHPAVASGGALARLADLTYRRRRTTVVAWLLVLLATLGLSRVAGGEFYADYTAPDSGSRKVLDLLADRFPEQSGDTVDVVFRAPDGIASPEVRADVESLLASLDRVDHVRSVSTPFAGDGYVSPDGGTARALLQLDVILSEEMPHEDTAEILRLAQQAERPGLEVALNGGVIGIAQQGEIGSEGIGLAAAAVILLISFGSVVAAGLPMLVALMGLVISGALVTLVAAAIDVPDWSTSLAAMMGIGVGIDYVMLLVARYREFLSAGLDPHRAAVATIDTAGRSVLVAGTTVVISLLGLSAMGLPFMTGAALATIAAVLVVMAAAVTLLPAMLGFVGTKINALKMPGRHLEVAASSSVWERWSRVVQRHAVISVAVSVGLLIALAAPFTGVRFGFPDAGSDPQNSSTRRAYDMVSDAFGVGANGPLLLAAELPSRGDVATVNELAAELRTTSGVAAVLPPQVNAAGDTALLTVLPTTSPQDPATERLLERLRADVVPDVVNGTGTTVYVGGLAAATVDITDNIASRLPALIGGVVGLSFLLLVVTFRSLAVAVKAAAVNLLSIGAAYGVVALVLEGGWAGQLVGIEAETPLPAFIPVLMFAILFGLSMDYEVFLLSRMREGWLRTRNNSASVASGLAITARVITAAAAIMVAVFAAFVPSDVIHLKVIGIGMATAILVDATIVRMLLVPAVMQLMGNANWWLPAAMDRRLPHLHVEGRPERYLPDPAAEAIPAARQPQQAAPVG